MTSDDQGQSDYHHVIETAFAFGRSQCLFAGVELDLFSALDDVPLTDAQVAERLNLHGRGCRNLLDALTSEGLLCRDRDRYTNSPAAARYLVRGKPAYVGELLSFAAARLYPVWSLLPQALRTGEPQNEARTEADYYTNLGGDSVRHARFLRAMSGLSTRPAVHLEDCFPWPRFRSLVDLGGAVGVVAAQLVRRFPHLHATVFDLPSVGPFFAATHSDFASTVTFHGGDFFVDPLPRADVHILGHVLHNWSESEKETLLRRVHDALYPGGAIIVYENLVDEARRRRLALLDGLNMLLVTRTGGSLTETECRALLDKVGFVRSEVAWDDDTVSVIVGWKREN